MPDIITRPYAEADIPDILQLLALSFPEYWGRSVQAGRSHLAFNSHPIVACSQGRLIGNCGILRTPVQLGAGRATVETVGCIGSVAVHPDFRGQGVAGAMLQAAIRQMRGEGITLSALFTDKPQVYAKHGWSVHPLTPAFTLPEPPPVRHPLPQTDICTGRPTAPMGDAIQALYAQGQPRFTGKLQRSGDYWQQRIFNGGDADTLWLVAAHANGPAAYALISHGTLCEAYSRDETLWPALLAAAAVQTSAEPLAISLHAAHPLRQLALAMAAPTPPEPAIDVYGETLMLNALAPATHIPDTLFWPKMDKF